MAVELYKRKNDEVLVWKAEDIAKLKHSYRIVGKLIGSHHKFPRQNQLMTRPMLLSPFETTLLLEKGFASLHEEDMSSETISSEQLAERQKVYTENFSRSLQEQRKLALESKKSDIMSRSEKIVSGIIRKRGKDPKTCSDEEKKSVLDEILLQAELNPLQEQNMLVEQPVETSWKQDLKEADWSFPQTDTQRIKYLAFKDLWQQDFHLSSGAKFGGDFLVYPGDPGLYHAQYIAICLQPSDLLCETDMVQAARLASNVHKTALFCSVDLATENVTYSKLDYCGQQ
ncbi:TSEN34 [Bugula neritina]|uniref:tRNA-splicing endonuclease subunit Sen34 n=1 Tax=Bugula neritina TaxID=10212 RepID=A0A7J7JJ77_BUGNE|nr:TSEN34 [Bugula neritina]